MKKAILFFLFSWGLYATPLVIKTTVMNDPFDIVFVADNQFNNYLASNGVLRNLAADNFISVALRPPALDLFAPDLFRLALKNHSNKRYIVHLGDALNISCDFEFDRFQDVLKIQENSPYGYKGFVMLPGNHDHIFIGNTVGSNFVKKSYFRKAWAKGCNIESFPIKAPKDISRDIMHKSKFVQRYLDLLYRQGKISKYKNDFPISKSAFSCSVTAKKSRRQLFEKSTTMQVCEWETKKKNSFLSRVYYELPTNRDVRISYRAKLLQMINFKTIKNRTKYLGIMLDSTDYSKPPSFGGTLVGGRNLLTGSSNPGLYGAFSKYQVGAVERWMKEEKEKVKKESSADKVVFIFMSHHPTTQFYGYSKKFVKRMLAENPDSFFITAHTHLGFLFKGRSPFEANVGSTTDFSPRYGLLNNPGRTKGKVFMVEAKLKPVEQGLCKKLTPKKTYVKYRTNYTKNLSKKYWEILTFYREMYQYMGVPSNALLGQLNKADYSKCKKDKCKKEMFDLLKKLHQFDDQFRSNRSNRYFEKRHEFGVCHGYWASKDEFYNTTKLIE